MPRAWQYSFTARRFATLTGCPPARFTVSATQMYGTRSAPTSRTSASSLARSTFPLNGCSDAGSCASSMITS